MKTGVRRHHGADPWHSPSPARSMIGARSVGGVPDMHKVPHRLAVASPPGGRRYELWRTPQAKAGSAPVRLSG
jgi:hypothetical protein